MAAKTSNLKFRFQVQVPTTVNELALSAYSSLTCYKKVQIECQQCE